MLNSLKGVIHGILYGIILGVIKGDSRSLDNCSSDTYVGLLNVEMLPTSPKP